MECSITANTDIYATRINKFRISSQKWNIYATDYNLHFKILTSVGIFF